MSASRVEVRRGTYHDSVTLMQVSRQAEELPGVEAAAAVAATPVNLELLARQGFAVESDEFGPSDLVVCVRAADEAAADRALEQVEALLAQAGRGAGAGSGSGGAVGAAPPRSLRAAGRRDPDLNLVVLSVPGRHLHYEITEALQAGLHVFCFSDGLDPVTEAACKRAAAERGLLLMGPDCGTAIIDGIGLGFANAVRRGPVGVVGASGTGIQEVTCLLDAAGVGISHAIGVGGRDLSPEVGGIMTLRALDLLAADASTERLVVISKPPDPEVARRVANAAAATGKPTILAFPGMGEPPVLPEGVEFAGSLEAAANWATGGGSAGVVGGWSERVVESGSTTGTPEPHPPVGGAPTGRVAASGTRGDRLSTAPPGVAGTTRGTQAPTGPAQAAQAPTTASPARPPTVTPGAIRGLFSGGTLCYEAMAVVTGVVGRVASNIPLRAEWRLADPHRSEGHTFVDFGDDAMTEGRAHPMIDPGLRNERFRREAADPGTGVLLLDVVLGYGAHPDPGGALAPLVERALADRPGGLSVVVSLCGAAGDPQGLDAQAAALRAAGALVPRSSAQAARLALAAAGLDRAGHQPRSGPAGRRRRRATVSGLLERPLRPVNVGVELFAGELERQGVEVQRVEWRPPAAGAEAALERLAARAEATAAANDRAVAAMQAAEPRVVGIGRAGDLLPDLDDRTLLHAGPPIGWADMCGPLRGAVIGAAVYEGMAADPEEAVRLAERGGLRFGPCHDRGAVGPMAGVVSASMPVWVVENAAVGNRAFCTLNEGLGKVLRYGAYDGQVLDRLAWMRDVLARVLGAALARLEEPLDLRALIAQALQMGDEGHNRNRAGTSLLLRALLPALLAVEEPTADVVAAAEFISGNDHFFLNLAMAAGKATADAAAGTAGSSVVTAMARNGTEFGVRLAGTGDRWFTGPAGVIDGLYLPGFGPEDANRDIGDSTITETIGIGGMAMAAAPAIVRFVGGTPEDAIAATLAMYDITWAESASYQVPTLGFRGTPLGIDGREVVHTGVLPTVNTGIAHKDPGVGQVGAGLVEPPMEAFVSATRALAGPD